VTSLLARAASLVVAPRATAEVPATTPPGASRALVLGAPAVAPALAAALAGTLHARERAPAALVCTWASAPWSGPSADGATTSAPGWSDPSADGTAVSAPGWSGPSAGGAAVSAPGRSGQPADGAAASAASGPASSVRSVAALGPAPSAWVSAGARRLAARLAARELVVRAAGRLVWLTLPPAPVEAARTLDRLLGWLDAPVVTALAGPRTPELDSLIVAHDLVVAVHPPASAGISPFGRAALAALALGGLGDEAVRAVTCEPLAGGFARWRALAGLARLPTAHPAVQALGAPGGLERPIGGRPSSEVVL
jgi:hypothetical protein